MRHAPPPPASVRRSGGFALLIVLWTLVLIAFIVAHLTASGRTEMRIAGNLVGNAAAAASADGGIAAAIFNLSNPQPDQRWPLDRAEHRLTIGNSQVVVRVEDEAARINPNSASPAILEALLRVVGNDRESAARLAAAIGEWVGSAPSPQPQAALLADYRAAGLDYGPPGEPLESLDELGLVRGMTPALLTLLRPHLTLFGPPEPNPADADPVVAAALAQIPRSAPAPAAAVASADVATVRIVADALGPGNARVRRVAVVRAGATSPQGYTVLAWGNDVD